MWTLALLLIGFILAAISMAALGFYLFEFEKRVNDFCDVVRERYRPSFHQDLEIKATAQIEKIASGLK